MFNVLSSDIIFATVRQRGRLLANLRISGVTSVNDILGRLSGKISGLATIDLRNSTQGWQRRHTVMIAA